MAIETLPADLSAHRVLGAAQAADLCNVSLAHWRRLYRTGKVPAPIMISTRKLGWRIGDLSAWLETRVRPHNDNATPARCHA